MVELTEDLLLNDNVDKLILTKLVLRRSNALIQLKEYGQAIESLKVCLLIDPSNTVCLLIIRNFNVYNFR